MKSIRKALELAEERLNNRGKKKFIPLYQSLDDENLYFLEFYQGGECITLEEARKRFGEDCSFILVRFVKEDEELDL